MVDRLQILRNRLIGNNFRLVYPFLIDTRPGMSWRERWASPSPTLDLEEMIIDFYEREINLPITRLTFDQLIGIYHELEKYEEVWKTL